MAKKYLIVARSNFNGGFVPADYFNDTREEALQDIINHHQKGLNGNGDWPIHTVLEIEIGPAAFNPKPKLKSKSKFVGGPHD